VNCHAGDNEGEGKKEHSQKESSVGAALDKQLRVYHKSARRHTPATSGGTKSKKHYRSSAVAKKAKKMKRRNEFKKRAIAKRKKKGAKRQNTEKA
jgi:hypothetical protein